MCRWRIRFAAVWATRSRQRRGSLALPVTRGGTYLVMEGPQFSTKAESELYRAWGCTVIGMTNMPEAKLAREAELCYATVAMVTDFDCWHPDHDHVTVEAVVKVLFDNADKARTWCALVPSLGAARPVARGLRPRAGQRGDHGAVGTVRSTGRKLERGRRTGFARRLSRWRASASECVTPAWSNLYRRPETRTRQIDCHVPGRQEFVMLDFLGIMFSSIIMFLVILRAIQMDSVQPWFKPPKIGPDSSGLRLRPDA